MPTAIYIPVYRRNLGDEDRGQIERQIVTRTD